MGCCQLTRTVEVRNEFRIDPKTGQKMEESKNSPNPQPAPKVPPPSKPNIPPQAKKTKVKVSTTPSSSKPKVEALKEPGVAFLNTEEEAKEVLFELYNCTDGENWTRNHNWREADDPVLRFGIMHLDLNDLPFQVTLTNNNLRGYVSSNVLRLEGVSFFLHSNPDLDGDPVPEEEIQALIRFYEASGGQQGKWRDSRGWNDPSSLPPHQWFSLFHRLSYSIFCSIVGLG